MRIRLDVSYVGTRFVGWQRQPNGLTVQADLEEILGNIYGHRIVVTGAGRTDSGVHARGQVAHFDTDKDRPSPDQICAILNKLLPPDISVMRSRRAPPDFHARKSAVRRTYLYRILTRPLPDPFRAPYVWHYPLASNADLDKMDQAAGKWIGRKDFSKFAIRVTEGESTYRHMEKISIRRVKDEIQMTFIADAFLHRMIRRMVPVLLGAGFGKTISQPALAAPAGGLCLMRVSYR